MANEDSGCFGCVSVIIVIIIAWALLYGVTMNGTHYYLDLSFDHGVSFGSDPVERGFR